MTGDGWDDTPSPELARAPEQQFADPYMADLKRFLLAEKERGRRTFPSGSNWFRALDLTPPEDVRVVILGQDPITVGPGARAVLFGAERVRPPPSLVNIYKGWSPTRHQAGSARFPRALGEAGRISSIACHG
jgi:uracil-DNA glycosylase